MEGVGARLGRSSARYGPATTFTGPVRKWRKEWVPIAAAAATAASAATSSTAAGSRGNNLVLFKWTPLNGANGGAGEGDGEQAAAAAETATRRRRYVPVSIVEDQRQESAKSDDENKANDGDPSSTETEPSNGKTNIDDTPMDESQASDEARDSGNNGGGTDLNLNLGPKDPDDEDEGDTGEQNEARTEHRLKRKSVTPDLEMRM
ncbi:uncharacterized protein LOC100836363 [Brachypodium distachyon]|uniref:Uncharacterized protein n=1 Tax=Brachypodium distachyon TaxID=15368 RepID=I1I3B8_BRADI|nr:uncharacterized protein LOC100836363 [Brachypodium distachyon]KQJ96323.1 hypothetical protein BRADI_3g22437v3 [Brachypodium distachyon]|eukprot:XP_003573802.1 uncharacterized protein LOC100836363 [Brachypodium distachyon]